MPTVGVIANPSAGQDIRRLVARGWNVPANEKINVLRRVFAGLDAVGVTRIIAMPDISNLCAVAQDAISEKLSFELLDMNIFNDEEDTSTAANLMVRDGVACVVTLGGDGTNRAVAAQMDNVPLVPISTGTNNVFPESTEGTVAGLAAGLVACNLVDIKKVTTRPNVLEVLISESKNEIALVDVAISKERFVGARAIWDMDTVHEIFLSRSEPATIGLSAIGAALPILKTDKQTGLHLLLGTGGHSVIAPIAPGLVRAVPVKEWESMYVDAPIAVGLSNCTIGLDGERSLTVRDGQTATVCLKESGPMVVDAQATIRVAAQDGLFTNNVLPINLD